MPHKKLGLVLFFFWGISGTSVHARFIFVCWQHMTIKDCYDLEWKRESDSAFKKLLLTFLDEARYGHLNAFCASNGSPHLLVTHVSLWSLVLAETCSVQRVSVLERCDSSCVCTPVYPLQNIWVIFQSSQLHVCVKHIIKFASK